MIKHTLMSVGFLGNLLGATAVISMTTAAAGQVDSLPPNVTPSTIERGRQLFEGSGNCWACHGEDAKGARGVGPNLTDDEWWHIDGSYEAIVRRIISGVPADSARNVFGAAMPPRGGSSLSSEDIQAVAAYVWSLSRSLLLRR